MTLMCMVDLLLLTEYSAVYEKTDCLCITLDKENKKTENVMLYILLEPNYLSANVSISFLLKKDEISSTLTDLLRYC